MPRIAYTLIFVILLLAASICLPSGYPQDTRLDTLPESSQKLLLLPLDSRPPCTQLVADNARTASIEILLPPSDLMDFYSLPGNTTKTKEWLLQKLPSCQGAIISIDQLLYGGLLASREHELPPEKIKELAEYLRQLHQHNPYVPLYAFSILPRMNPPDKIDGYHDRKNLMKWSKLTGQLLDNAFESELERKAAISKLAELEAIIPQKALSTYKERYERSLSLSKALVDLANEGVLAHLVFAQDDGEAHSYPNYKLKELLCYINSSKPAHSHVKNSISIIHGADEVALSLLAGIVKKGQTNTFKAYIDYNAPNTKSTIPQYMAISIEDTIKERLKFHDTIIADTPDDADYILLASYGNTDNLSQRQNVATKLKEYYSQGKPVALVDLSHHFSAQETVFPIMLKAGYPIHSLLAYAGWNTASNSIGTAIAQAEICLTALQKARTSHQPAEPILNSNLLCLNNRYMEDYYYLKETIDIVNANLHQQGYNNVNDLDLEHNFRTTTAILQRSMKQQVNKLISSTAFQTPFTLPYHPHSPIFQAGQMNVETGFPWPRTFEVWLQSDVTFYRKP